MRQAGDDGQRLDRLRLSGRTEAKSEDGLIGTANSKIVRRPVVASCRLKSLEQPHIISIQGFLCDKARGEHVILTAQP
jgi:hypothetical protein